MTQRLLVTVATLFLTATGFAEVEESVQCEESEITVTDQLKVKKVFATSSEDSELLTLHFHLPTSIDGASFNNLYLTIVGDDNKTQLSTPLSTWVMDENLEAVLFVSQSRYKEYSLAAHYFPETGCPTLGMLDLSGNKMIENYLSCIRENGWMKCHWPEPLKEGASDN